MPPLHFPQGTAAERHSPWTQHCQQRRPAEVRSKKVVAGAVVAATSHIPFMVHVECNSLSCRLLRYYCDYYYDYFYDYTATTTITATTTTATNNNNNNSSYYYYYLQLVYLLLHILLLLLLLNILLIPAAISTQPGREVVEEAKVEVGVWRVAWYGGWHWFQLVEMFAEGRRVTTWMLGPAAGRDVRWAADVH